MHDISLYELPVLYFPEYTVADAHHAVPVIGRAPGYQYELTIPLVCWFTRKQVLNSVPIE